MNITKENLDTCAKYMVLSQLKPDEMRTDCRYIIFTTTANRTKYWTARDIPDRGPYGRVTEDPAKAYVYDIEGLRAEKVDKWPCGFFVIKGVFDYLAKNQVVESRRARAKPAKRVNTISCSYI